MYYSFTITAFACIFMELLLSSVAFKPRFAHAPYRSKFSSQASTVMSETGLAKCPFEDMIPYVSEHVQISDQMLVLGADSDFPLQMARAGYGTSKTGFLLVVDSDEEKIAHCAALAKEDVKLAPLLANGRLKFQVADLANMKEVCRQSVFDAIVDYGALDHQLSKGQDKMLSCIDHLQNSLRLGNILITISRADKQKFCSVFEQRFGKLSA